MMAFSSAGYAFTNRDRTSQYKPQALLRSIKRRSAVKHNTLTSVQITPLCTLPAMNVGGLPTGHIDGSGSLTSRALVTESAAGGLVGSRQRRRAGQG